MSHSCGRRARLLLAALVFVCGCRGDDDEGGSGNPGGPSNTPPPSGVVSVAGTNWTGASSFQQSGVFYNSNLSATIRQTDRTIEGTITFTSPGWSGWIATFSGQLSGNSPESQFFGNITLQAAPQSGGGTCSGTVQMSGATRANTLRWEAPILSIRPTGSNAGSTVCLGDVLTIVWTLNR
jgi:hypothetical protein